VITVREVCEWIRGLGKKYVVYADVFKKKDVDGYWLLNRVDDGLLQEYEITDEDHRTFILNEIEQLKKNSKVSFVDDLKTTN
jgi:hypothetical protein